MNPRRDHGEAAGHRQQAAADPAGQATRDDEPDPVALLPDDVLAAILRRLPPRCLAVSRCVCAAWRAAVDARRLLRADLLPLSLAGILINFKGYYTTEFLSSPAASAAGRPSSSAVSGKHDYLPEAARSRSWGYVCDHCNGLLLVHGYDYQYQRLYYVLNPATRMSLASDKYHVTKLPTGIEAKGYPQIYLGKSAEGIYCAAIKGRCRVQIWNLAESGCNMEWVLKHDKHLCKWLAKHKLEHTRPYEHGQKVRGPWTLQDINYYYDEHDTDDDSMEAPVEEEFECSSQVPADEKSAWSSDDECISDKYYHGSMDILGFRPFEEIIFLSESITRGLAYHFNSSKVEVLGNIYPEEYHYEDDNGQLIESSFPYTPCWLGQTAEENS
ncbi:unnamed protein product [Urochloa decumbens]|uniref:F-box domain-containing protein n=1 Tax=Urochloa decumbens TaxID=240449 RepID=A0ABC8YHF3_9POAL